MKIGPGAMCHSKAAFQTLGPSLLAAASLFCLLCKPSAFHSRFWLSMSITVPVAGDGSALLYCVIVLLVLTSFIFVLRIGVRVWRKSWGTDGYLMLTGVVCN